MTTDPVKGDAVQTIARGPRAEAEAAALAIDADAATESLTYSILEEDEDRDVWRIDAFPTTEEEQATLVATLAGFPKLRVVTEKLADADWLAMALSGLPPVRAGRFFVYGAHDKGPGLPASCHQPADRGRRGLRHRASRHDRQGCLLAFDQLLKRRRFERVLDVGCGTGVLAIAAARTGSRVALGTDIDAPSVRIANENAALNRAKARFVHASGLNDARVRKLRFPMTWCSPISWPRRWWPWRRTSGARFGPAGSPSSQACCAPRNAGSSRPMSRAASGWNAGHAPRRLVGPALRSAPGVCWI